jgi:Family of unknown function (DUF6152)
MMTQASNSMESGDEWTSLITVRLVDPPGRFHMKSKLLTLAGRLMVSVPTFAPHGFARYDTAKLITVKETVTDFQFSNPHVEVDFMSLQPCAP